MPDRFTRLEGALVQVFIDRFAGQKRILIV